MVETKSNNEVTWNYNQEFDVEWYLKTYYAVPGDLTKFFCQGYRRFFEKYDFFFNDAHDKRKLVWLDVGSGPCIYSFIYGTQHFNRVIASEYGQPLRQQIMDWKNGKNNTYIHDWATFFSKVYAGDNTVSISDQQSQRSESTLEQLKLKLEVVGCNVLCDKVLRDHHNSQLANEFYEGKQFSLVSSNLCLEAACDSPEQFQLIICRICNLVEENGFLLLGSVLGESFYLVGDRRFGCLNVKYEDLALLLQKNGLVIDKELSEMKSYSYGENVHPEYNFSDFTGLSFIAAQKIGTTDSVTKTSYNEGLL